MQASAPVSLQVAPVCDNSRVVACLLFLELRAASVDLVMLDRDLNAMCLGLES